MPLCEKRRRRRKEKKEKKKRKKKPRRRVRSAELSVVVVVIIVTPTLPFLLCMCVQSCYAKNGSEQPLKRRSLPTSVHYSGRISCSRRRGCEGFFCRASQHARGQV